MGRKFDLVVLMPQIPSYEGERLQDLWQDRPGLDSVAVPPDHSHNGLRLPVY